MKLKTIYNRHLWAIPAGIYILLKLLFIIARCIILIPVLCFASFPVCFFPEYIPLWFKLFGILVCSEVIVSDDLKEMEETDVN